jgi:hypothetical protein
MRLRCPSEMGSAAMAGQLGNGCWGSAGGAGCHMAQDRAA